MSGDQVFALCVSALAIVGFAVGFLLVRKS